MTTIADFGSQPFAPPEASTHFRDGREFFALDSSQPCERELRDMQRARFTIQNEVRKGHSMIDDREISNPWVRSYLHKLLDKMSSLINFEKALSPYVERYKECIKNTSI